MSIATIDTSNEVTESEVPNQQFVDQLPDSPQRLQGERLITIIGAPEAGKTAWGVQLSRFPSDEHGSISFDEPTSREFQRLCHNSYDCDLPLAATGMAMPRDIRGVVISDDHRYPLVFQDYAGALIKLTLDPALHELKAQLRQSLCNSDAVLFFLDISNPDLGDRLLEFNLWANVLLSEDEGTTRIGRPLGLVITKWDQYNDTLPEIATDEDIVKEQQDALLRLQASPQLAQILGLLAKVGRRFAIIPISSLGVGSYGGVPSETATPFNILGPIHWAVQQSDEDYLLTTSNAAKAAAISRWSWIGLDRAAELVRKARQERGISTPHPLAIPFSELEEAYRAPSLKLKIRHGVIAVSCTLAMTFVGFLIDDSVVHQRFHKLIDSPESTVSAVRDACENLQRRWNPFSWAFGRSLRSERTFNAFLKKRRDDDLLALRGALVEISGQPETSLKLIEKYEAEYGDLSSDVQRIKVESQQQIHAKVANQAYQLAYDENKLLLQAGTESDIRNGVAHCETVLKENTTDTPLRKRLEQIVGDLRSRANRQHTIEELEDVRRLLANRKLSDAECDNTLKRTDQIHKECVDDDLKQQIVDIRTEIAARQLNVYITNIKLTFDSPNASRVEILRNVFEDARNSKGLYKERLQQLYSELESRHTRDLIIRIERNVVNATAPQLDSLLAEINQSVQATKDASNRKPLEEAIASITSRRDTLQLKEIQDDMQLPKPPRSAIHSKLELLLVGSTFQKKREAKELSERNLKCWDDELWQKVLLRGREGSSPAALEGTHEEIDRYLNSGCPVLSRRPRAKSWQEWFQTLSRESDVKVTIVSAMIPTGCSIERTGTQRPGVTLLHDGHSFDAPNTTLSALSTENTSDRYVDINKSITLTKVKNLLHARIDLQLYCQGVIGTSKTYRSITATELNSAVTFPCRNAKSPVAIFKCEQLIAPKLED